MRVAIPAISSKSLKTIKVSKWVERTLAVSSCRFFRTTFLKANAGDYVSVHVGFARGNIDEKEAARICWLLEEIDQSGELEV